MVDDNKDSPDEVWEAIQITTREIYVYRGGFKDEADIENVYNFSVSHGSNNVVKLDFSRFDFHPLTPSANSKIRFNRSNILFAWYIDPNSNIVRQIKKAAQEMTARKAGIILPTGA